MRWFEFSKNSLWGYILLKEILFEIGDILPNMIITNASHHVVAIICDGNLSLFPGYKWDGSSIIGRIFETEKTLKASLLHDFLYHLSAQKNYTIPYSRKDADKIFKKYLPWYVKSSWFVCVRIFGKPYFKDIKTLGYDTLFVKLI